MNLILLFENELGEDGKRVRLGDRRWVYVRDVHRARVGDELCVGLMNGRIGRGRVLRLDEKGLELEVELSEDPPQPLPVTLILALPRPPVLKRVLISATSMGVKRIVLINPRRVDRSFWSSSALRPDALREQLILGLEQARDTLMPEVLQRPRFRPFVEDELPALVDGGRALVAHPDAGVPCPTGLDEPVTLAVGPEGGFSDYEIEKLEICGFSKIDLGPRILRVETAVPALLAKLF
jgi:RsmE family RNA methyltransferase